MARYKFTDDITGAERIVDTRNESVFDALRDWYENAPDDIRSALVKLDTARDAEWHELLVFLGLTAETI